MPRYRVSIKETHPEYVTVIIEDSNKGLAKTQAENLAPDIDASRWKHGDSDYEVTDIEEVDEDTPLTEVE